MKARPIIQGSSLTLFVVLLVLVAVPGIREGVPADMFLRMDPSGAAIAMIAAGTVLAAMWPALLLVVLTLAFGRFFCGHICPMGTLVDVSDKLLGPGRDGRADPPAWWRTIKHQILAAFILAAILGVSLHFLLSPIPLATRFIGLLVLPLARALAAMGLDAVRPVFHALDVDSLAYLQLGARQVATQWVVLILFAAIFSLSRLGPRIWCRCLCPAGAIFSLFSRRPLYRRRVTDECIDCGLCATSCPTRAIPGHEVMRTMHSECVACRTCVQVCPVHAVQFSFSVPEKPAQERAEEERSSGPETDMRRYVLGGLAGILAAFMARTSPFGWRVDPAAADVPAGLPSPLVIRPPGAMPEHDFLALCLRCGECMAACPTNTLQSILLEAGPAALFSPTVTPVIGPCDPLCNLCGRVCPSGALRPIPMSDRMFAKIGTASIIKRKCLAWEQGRECLVCDETCPYGAIDLVRSPDSPVAVPVVREDRCAGCGFCQRNCPVTPAKAIVVEATGALRIGKGSYEQAAREQGLRLSFKDVDSPPSGHQMETAPEEATMDEGLPPGFAQPEAEDLPPGFAEPGDVE